MCDPLNRFHSFALLSTERIFQKSHPIRGAVKQTNLLFVILGILPLASRSDILPTQPRNANLHLSCGLTFLRFLWRTKSEWVQQKKICSITLNVRFARCWTIIAKVKSNFKFKSNHRNCRHVSFPMNFLISCHEQSSQNLETFIIWWFVTTLIRMENKHNWLFSNRKRF